MAELRLAVRTLLKSPVVTTVAVLSLALGIGANTALFTLVDQILLRLLPVREPRELVQLRLEGGRVGSQNGDGLHTFSYPLYLEFRDKNTVLSGLTGIYQDRVSMSGEDRSEMIGITLVAGNYFDVLGVRPHLGRLLTLADDTESTNPVAVLQYGFWRKRFGGNNRILGSTIRLNGSPFTVVGVAAPDFEGTNTGLPTQVWAPVTVKSAINPPSENLKDERYAWFYLFGRLKPGVSLEQAQAALRVLYRQRQEEELKAKFFVDYPDLKDRFLRGNFTLIPASRGQSALRERFERPLIVLQWLVGLVLLIACVNVANLLLARAAARQKEVAIRAALGASRGQLVRQLLAESLLLAVAGGACGLFLSVWMARGLVRFLPYDPANLSLGTSPDPRVLLFTTTVILLTTLIAGLVPALQGSRVPAAMTLREEAGSIAGGRGHVRLRKTLVALQVVLSTILLAGAGLFARTLQNLQNVDLGFKVENVVMFGVRPATVYDEARRRQVFRALIENLAAVPGVKAVGANTSRLLTGGRWDSNVTIPGLPAKGDDYPWSFFNAVTPGYFEALNIPVRMGRDFTWNDWESAQNRCLVNEAFVKEYFKGANPVGRMMAQGREKAPDTEIIGVFANACYHDVRGQVPRQTFVSMSGQRFRGNSLNVYARTDRDPRQVMPQLREQVRRLDANLVVFDMRTLDDQLNMRLSNERLLSFLSTGFALVATILAVVGLYGVLAYVVTRRTREIGIRMALGAARGSVIGLVLREIMLIIGIGLGAGLIASFIGGRYVETQLFGVKASDPVILALSAIALLCAASAAGFVPAWRASRIDPVRALRWE